MPSIAILTRALFAPAIAFALGTSLAPKASFGAELAGAQKSCLLTVAEALETLTEHAARAPIVRLIAEARAATVVARKCEAALGPSQGSELTQVLAHLGQFATDRNRAALALNAVEGFRILVTAQARGPHDVPLEVALLDYAGFRYQAGAQASPALWGESQQAVAIADEQWRRLSPRISDKKLQTSFGASIEAMRVAAQAGTVNRARRAASTELRLVDDLEQFFAKHSPQ